VQDDQEKSQEPQSSKELEAKAAAVELKLSEFPESIQRKIADLAGNNPTRVVAMQSKTTTYQGPIPPPQMLAAYDAVEHGLADRIVKMAEKSLDHQTKMQSRQLTYHWLEVFVGQVFGLVIALAFLCAGVYLAMNDHPWPGVISSSTGIATLVGLFIYGRSGKSEKPKPRGIDGNKSKNETSGDRHSKRKKR